MILITGANRGIGAALLSHYHDNGDQVRGTARRPSDGLLPLDVTDPQSVKALAADLPQPLDLLVCNAGINPGRGALDSGYPPRDWADTFQTNVTGVFLCIQAFLPQLRAAKGKIAIISSRMGSDDSASGGSLIYRASKAAALNLGRNLAADLKAQGIAVGIYHPGWVQTDMGGRNASITPPVSAEGLARRFAALSPDTTGCFENYDGTPIAF